MPDMAKARAQRGQRAGKQQAKAAPTAGDPCPCGLGRAYGECCGAFHQGRASAPTAEALMRSRYSAFAVGDEPYLLRSWHPSTRPGGLGLDPAQRWLRLEILDTEGGSAFHTEGVVEFRAYFRDHGHEDVLHERSRFVRDQGAWVYLDGEGIDAG